MTEPEAGSPADSPTDPTDDAVTVALVLAAGEGRRFAGPTHKLLAPLPPTAQRPAETVATRSIASALAAGIGPVVVVTGAVDLRAAITDAVGEGAEPQRSGGERSTPGPLVVHNPRWADGQSTSLRAGLAAAADLGAERVVVGLADQPGLTPDAWRAVADAGTSSPIAVATYDGRRGHPVSLSRQVWELLDDQGDQGARTLMRIRPDLVGDVPCIGSPGDIDTVEDLTRWPNN